MKRKTAFTFFISFISLPTFSQPSIQWQKCLGGTGIDNGCRLTQANDGGYIVSGASRSNNGDVSGNHNPSGNYSDSWIIKLDNLGIISWQKCFGGTAIEGLALPMQTTDGGYILAGSTGSNDGDVSGNHGNDDVWVLKLNSTGDLQWQKCLGGTSFDGGYSIYQTNDGGYILAGYTSSNDGDVMGNHGDMDYWVVKLGNSGAIQWQKCIGGTGRDAAYFIQQTNDGGYIVAGSTSSNDGDVNGNHGSEDAWIVKLNNGGVIQWQKCLGGLNPDEAKCIQQTNDGGYIITGSTYSVDGDVVGNHGGEDFWIIKLSSVGNLQWQKCLGGTLEDSGESIQETADGGYVASGYTYSVNGDVTGNHDISGTYPDYWIVKLNNAGLIQWEKCLGGTNSDWGYSIHQTNDAGYIVGGTAISNNGNVSGNHGLTDYWVVKLGPEVGILENGLVAKIVIFPNPVISQLIISSEQHTIDLVEIFNVLGEKVFSLYRKGTSALIDVSMLTRGIYFVAVRDGKNNLVVRKVVKM